MGRLSSMPLLDLFIHRVSDYLVVGTLASGSILRIEYRARASCADADQAFYHRRKAGLLVRFGRAGTAGQSTWCCASG